MIKEFEFSKGIFRVGESRILGEVKASTSMDQAPDILSINAGIGNFGPISINEIKQFRYILAPAGFIVSIIIGGMVVFCVDESEYGSITHAADKINNILSLFSIFGVVAAAAIFKWLHVYMAQFPHNGQTVYVPFLKKNDIPVMEALDAYITSLKHDHHTAQTTIGETGARDSKEKKDEIPHTPNMAKEKLLHLEELRTAGLVSEEEYAKKRGSILDDF